MIEYQKESAETYLQTVGRQMMNAARTAPKGRGVDNLELVLLTGQERAALAARMIELAENEQVPPFFARDGHGVEVAGAVVLIGSRYVPLGLNCGWCGYATCEQKTAESPDAPCFFNANDMGIAVGSAVAVAADCRVDNRVMYSVGVVARAMGLLPQDCRAVLGIPISVTSKSPFFDRG